MRMIYIKKSIILWRVEQMGTQSTQSYRVEMPSSSKQQQCSAVGQLTPPQLAEISVSVAKSDWLCSWFR
jgi:hypothetical protein